MKRCTYCKKKKSIEEFVLRRYKSGKMGTRSYCKKCGNVALEKWKVAHPWSVREKDKKASRRKHLAKKYGMTESDYRRMFDFQNGKCAICDIAQDKVRHRLSVDHNHRTGVVRALLCVKCNTGIGSLRSIEVLRKAIEYYELHGE